MISLEPVVRALQYTQAYHIATFQLLSLEFTQRRQQGARRNQQMITNDHTLIAFQGFEVILHGNRKILEGGYKRNSIKDILSKHYSIYLGPRT